MNRVILMGRLTRAPESRQTGKEKKIVTRFRLAVDRRGEKQEGRQNADFISCVAWDKLGEFAANYLKQGTRIVLEGRLTTGSYEKDGQRVYTTEVTAENIEFAESKKSQEQEAGGFTEYGEGFDDGEVPF